MKVAISNLAWHPSEDGPVAELMVRHGASGVELAPTKIWEKPLEVPPVTVAAYRRSWELRGLPVVSMQALLFGRPELTIFESRETREATALHLEGMIRLGHELGATVLVLGSPRNRRVGSLDGASVLAIAQDFFGRLGDFAGERGVCFCIEPNPAPYGCDFVRTTAEAMSLVAAVARPGFGLHLDSGGMTLAGEDHEVSIREAGPYARHFHVSEPELKPVGEGGTPHAVCAAALRSAGYERWVSIEMRDVEAERRMTVIEEALRRTAEIYGDRV